jgi:hypothetical protein
MVNRQQYPLAFDVDGNPLDVPEEAVAWRVRRNGGRGRPRTIFDPETGLQLDIPITSKIEDLIERGCEPERYRLEAVDREGRVIPALVAIVEVAAVATPADAVAALQIPPDADALRQMTIFAGQMVEANARTMQALASAFGTVHPVQAQQHAPAPIVLEQAAPLPAESGMKPEQIMTMIMQLAPMLVSAFKSAAGAATVAGVGA